MKKNFFSWHGKLPGAIMQLETEDLLMPSKKNQIFLFMYCAFRVFLEIASSFLFKRQFFRHRQKTFRGTIKTYARVSSDTSNGECNDSWIIVFKLIAHFGFFRLAHFALPYLQKLSALCFFERIRAVKRAEVSWHCEDTITHWGFSVMILMVREIIHEWIHPPFCIPYVNVDCSWFSQANCRTKWRNVLAFRCDLKEATFRS